MKIKTTHATLNSNFEYVKNKISEEIIILKETPLTIQKT